MPGIRKWSARSGNCPTARCALVETLADAQTFVPKDENKLAFVTQTTLSLDDTAEIAAALKKRFPAIVGPHKDDICYATTNRQEAVKRVAPLVDAMIVVGSPNSSNSQRLREVSERAGCKVAALVLRAEDIDWDKFGNIAFARCHRGRLGAGSAGRGNPRRLRRALHGSKPRPCRRPKRTCSFRCRARCGPRRRSSGWRSIPTSGRTSSTPSSTTTTSARCSPTRASPKAWRIPISSCTPTPAITS